MDSTPVVAPSQSPAKRILPPQPLRAAIVIGSFTALLYVIELINTGFLHDSLRNDGIQPRDVGGLTGILWAPLIHASWAHLAGNTVPILVFGFLAMALGIGPWITITAAIWLVSGIGVWLIAPGGSVTIGASGLAFGWLAFLLVRGLFNRSVGQILVSLVLLFYWGSVLWGLLPGRPEISWQGHLFGALAGILCAWLVARANRRPATRTGPVTPTIPGNLGL